MTHDDDQPATPASEERRSTPNSSGPEAAAGGMGSSSERVGPTGGGQVGTDGLRDTSRLPTRDEAPQDQDVEGEESAVEGVEPKAGYPRLDPRHERKPYRP